MKKKKRRSEARRFDVATTAEDTTGSDFNGPVLPNN